MSACAIHITLQDFGRLEWHNPSFAAAQRIRVMVRGWPSRDEMELAAGASREEMLADYPDLEPEDRRKARGKRVKG